jgi:transglutaminase-like putative cysteine protease
MRYRIRHTTRYDYDNEISISHHVVRAQPRNFSRQECLSHDLEISPPPATQSSHEDCFGNTVVLLTVEGPHRQFRATASSEVDVLPFLPPSPEATLPWEQVRDRCAREEPGALEAVPFLFGSPLAPSSAQLAAFAAPHFQAGRPWLSALGALMHHIHEEFAFDPAATHLATPVEVVLRQRRGVCQDFAHLTLASLRSLGLPARYVSGYLETHPPPGQPRLVGADASHAWVSAFLPEVGWIDLDPTNNSLPSDQHITVAWGRDYNDVSPVRGVLVGAGDHHLKVSVDVELVSAAP